MYSTSDGLVQSTEIIRRVRNFIRLNTNNREFNGNFVFVANWSEMHPWPAGQSLYDEHFYLHMVSEFYLQVYVCTYSYREIRIKQS